MSANLGRRTAHGGMIAIGSQVARLFVQIAGTAILSRLLAPSDFGLVAMAATVTVFVAMFTDMGLSAATIQRAQISQQTVSTLFYINLAVGLGLMAIAAAAAPVAAWFFGDPRIASLVIGLALAIPLSAAGAQHGALLARGMRWVPLQLIGIVAQVIALAAAVVLAWRFDLGYHALVAQTVIAALVTLLLNWTACQWRPSLVWQWREARSEIGFGLYLTGFNFLNYFHRQFDNVLIGWRYGSVELGYYNRAYNLLTMPITVINSSVSQAAVPALSRLNEDPPAWRNAFLQLVTASAIGGIGICTVLFVAAEPLVHLLLGEQWTPVIGIFRCLVVASIFATATNGCGWAFISLGKSREFFHWSLFASPLFVLSFALGLPWGAQGVAIGYSIAMALLAPIYLAYTARHAGFGFLAAARMLYPTLLIAAAVAVMGDIVLAELAITSLFWRLVVASALAAALYLFCTAACLFLLPRYGSLKRLIAGLLHTRKIVLS